MASKPGLPDHGVRDPVIDHIGSLTTAIENEETIDEAERMLGSRDILQLPAAFRWLQSAKVTSENTYNFCHQVAVMVANKLNKRLIKGLGRVLDQRFREVERRLKDLEDGRP